MTAISLTKFENAPPDSPAPAIGNSPVEVPAVGVQSGLKKKADGAPAAEKNPDGKKANQSHQSSLDITNGEIGPDQKMPETNKKTVSFCCSHFRRLFFNLATSKTSSVIFSFALIEANITDAFSRASIAIE